MKSVKVEELTVEKFLPFGFFSKMINPESEKIGAPPLEFFRDMLQMDLGGHGQASFSTCRIEKRPLVVDVSEYHSFCGEAAMPLDNDMYIHVAPAGPVDSEFPSDDVKVFRVPKGVMTVIRPGVWHHGPFTVNDDPVNVLIVLPERTYANDCEVVELTDEFKIQIEA